MFGNRINRRLAAACLCLAATATGGPAAHAADAHDRPVVVLGESTVWQLALLRTRSMYSIPHTTWSGYKANFFRMFVMTIRLTNVGERPASPLNDLGLVIRVEPQYPTRYISGFATLAPSARVFRDMMVTAAHEFGGVPLWYVARPGQTLLYSLVIAANRGDAHYGLYNYLPRQRPVFLAHTGL